MSTQARPPSPLASRPGAGGQRLRARGSQRPRGPRVVVANATAAATLEGLDLLRRLAGARDATLWLAAGPDAALRSAVPIPHGAEGPATACGTCAAAARTSASVWSDQACRRGTGCRAADAGQAAHPVLALPLTNQGALLGVCVLHFGARAGPRSPRRMALLHSASQLLGAALSTHAVPAGAPDLLQRERQAMAAEVHDALGQSLSFVKMRLAVLEDALRGADAALALRYCAELVDATGDAQASLRSLLTHFRSTAPAQGLAAALTECAAAFRQSSRTRLDCRIELPPAGLGPQREAQLFQVVRESLGNVARHAAARQAWLRLRPLPGGLCELQVEDDGVGMAGPLAAGPSHYGLSIMSERARRLGGTLEFGPGADGSGTRLRLVFPLAAPGAQERAP